MLYFKSVTQADILADLLLVEVKRDWTRESAVIGPGDALPLGAVLVKAADSSLNPPAPGDTQAYAVLGESLPASTEPRKGLVIARGATLDADLIQWADTLSEADRVVLSESLETRGILLRAAL